MPDSSVVVASFEDYRYSCQHCDPAADSIDVDTTPVGNLETHIHAMFKCHVPGKSELADCLLYFHSVFIPQLCILLHRPKVLLISSSTTPLSYAKKPP